ncbi:pantoate--beta-alanine ligase [Thiotrichales bacterium 19S3-7]|nr:pantoate--beta-alanine ligase [Thiotrichales bacterium 19S3-7]MCF6802005.1 pantoate--beta-alanine ligase [Thiotrichales bacterium 19S3-11]
MEVINEVSHWRRLRKSFLSTLTIGFVPTMGCLHQGHASLIKKSVTENDLTILSIFVNPTQFNDKNDFNNYPLTPEDDLRLAENLGADYVLMPPKEALYPDNYLTKIITDHPLSKTMEGEFRVGHFDGVLTIVMKLLQLVKANNAYFGEKDYQQFRLIQSMTDAFFIDTKIISCPTVREAESNLALSSRNTRLNHQQKNLAKQYATIFNQYRNNPELINQKLTALGINIEYIKQYENRLLSAVKIGDIRLIDNVEL